MTILAILADIHGNLPALEAVQKDFEEFGVDHVIVAGDIINWGPFSPQVVKRVVESQWAVLRGNNEFYLLDYDTPRQPEHWRGYALLPWLQRQLAGQWKNRIGAWPDTLNLLYSDGPPIRVLHGTPISVSDGIFASTPNASVQAIFASVEETTIITAHTHLPMERRVAHWHFVNPGSVGVPLDGTSAASYAILKASGDKWTVFFRRVAFDTEPIVEEFRRQRFLEECGVIGSLVMKEFLTSRLQVMPFLAWHSARFPEEPLTKDSLTQFSEQDRKAFLPDPYD